MILLWSEKTTNSECPVAIHEKNVSGFCLHIMLGKFTLRSLWFRTDLTFYHWIVMNQYWNALTRGSGFRIITDCWEILLASKQLIWIEEIYSHHRILNWQFWGKHLLCLQLGQKIKKNNFDKIIKQLAKTEWHNSIELWISDYQTLYWLPKIDL